MHDIRWIRDNPDAFDRGLARRGLEPLAGKLISLDETRRALITKLEQALARRNAASKEIGQAKAKKDETTAQKLMAEVAELKESMPAMEAEEKAASAALEKELAQIPNLPLDDVPDGKDEHDNVEYRTWGKKRNYAFAPKQHFDLGEALGQMDFELAAKLSGARFVVLQKGLARLERALGQLFLDTHTEEHGYTEVNPPILVRDDVMFGTAQLPKFAEDQFRTTNEFWLIPTAEVPLTNLVRESIVDEDKLPMRLTACTPCFRAEAGAAGKDTRGMIRQHQFTKVELVSIATPEQALAEHERMLESAEKVLQKLDLHYRVVTLCTGDMGFASRKTYDIEVWLPGQNMFREISSCSVCGDFQARRMNARYRGKDGKVKGYVHTLNGSGVAVGRALIAVMETYQQADGSIVVPDALASYMGGVKVIAK
ncbi:MAG: serine--tRNA ligase [Xanthobacteraceae bacterium]|uniref:serine--tRNA ligase n=1 Tax=Pseudolabrys sp. TaxID=1960880 RepID=UPI003D0A4B93